MKNFLEKMKDILYDGMDYIIMIGIIAAIALIINWKLDGLFSLSDVNELYAQSSESTDEKVSEDENKNINPSDEEKEEGESSEDEETTEETNTEESNENKEVITISIPAGSLPGDIGNILVSEGLLESKDEFLKKVIDNNLETKLRYGKFKIAKNSSVEEILEILVR